MKQPREKTSTVQQPLSMEASPSPLSSRPKRRDLQFRGPFLEMFFRHTNLLPRCFGHALCVACVKESCMRIVNVTKLNRKSGERRVEGSAVSFRFSHTPFSALSYGFSWFMKCWDEGALQL